MTDQATPVRQQPQGTGWVRGAWQRLTPSRRKGGDTREGQVRTLRRRSRAKSSVEYWWSQLRAPDNTPLPASVYERIDWYEQNAPYQRKMYYAAEIMVILLSRLYPRLPPWAPAQESRRSLGRLSLSSAVCGICTAGERTGSVRVRPSSISRPR